MFNPRGCTTKAKIYTLYIKTNFKECFSRLEDFLKIPINKSNIEELVYKPKPPIEEPIQNSTESIENSDIEGIEILKNKKLTNKNKPNNRKAPKENSKLFDVGYEKISENDGKLYVVYLTPNNNKRWKLK